MMDAKIDWAKWCEIIEPYYFDGKYGRPPNDTSEAFKVLLTNSLNAVLKAKSAEQLKAMPYERSKDRTDSRNGFRERILRPE